MTEEFYVSMSLTLLTLLSCRGHQELQAVSTAIQTVLSTPMSVATALKGIQKTLGKALPFKVWRHLYLSWSFLSCLIEEKQLFKTQFSIMSVSHNSFEIV